MLIPLIVTIIISILTTIILNILENKQKISRGSNFYRIIKVIGVYVPILIAIIYHVYNITDTVKETLIVLIATFILIF